MVKIELLLLLLLLLLCLVSKCEHLLFRYFLRLFLEQGHNLCPMKYLRISSVIVLSPITGLFLDFKFYVVFLV